MGRLRRFVWALTRRKPMDISDEAPTDLDRCLNTLDLTAMGVGATLGFGLYVLSGEVAAQKAGPGVVLSFMIAAIASTFSALCYAEFAAKVPKSGSAYAYSYITVGEFVAFVIGWNLTLEHVIGTASLARGYSGYLGSLFMSQAEISASGNQTLTALAHHEPIEWLPHFMQSYVTHFDSLAFFLTMLVTGLLLLGVQVSSRFQITFATINLSVACFIFVCGLFKADFHNWNLTKAEIPATAGEGGFLPFGLTGVVAGAGTCFFAFVGFDGIAATAEEVKNPRKAIPNSILWTSGIIFITYCCMATIQTLIWPYWDQKQAAPLPYIFDKLGMGFAKWTILVGVLAGLSTSFVGGFLPLPRILYAMARDGVIYRVLAVVSKRFKVPIVATIIGGLLIACLASMLEIDQLADMLSIGTLAAYSLVSISVLLLRYEYRRPTSSENPLPVTLRDSQEAVKRLEQKVKKSSLSLGNGGGGGGAGGAVGATTNKGENLQLSLQTNGLLGSLDNAKTKTKTTNGIQDKTTNGKEALAVAVAVAAGLGPTQAPASASASSTGGDDHADDAASASGSSTTATTSTTTTASGRKDDCDSMGAAASSSSGSGGSSSGSSSMSSRSLVSLFVEGTRLPGSNQVRRPDEQTTHISRVMILILVVVTTLLDFALVAYGPTLYLLEPVGLGLCLSLFALTLFLGYLLNRLPVAEPSTNSFEVPLVPTIPLFSVIINTYLMLNLSVMTWIRFAVWMAIGFFIYFTYGIFKSTGYKDSRCD